MPHQIWILRYRISYHRPNRAELTVHLSSRSSFFAGLVLASLNVVPAGVATADEAGVSFWLPGQYASYAAVPGKPGLSFEATFYHATASAGAGASFERGGQIEAGVKAPSDFVMLTPTYSFESRLLGGQPALGMTALVGRNVTSASTILSGPGGGTLSGTKSDQVFGFGDLYLSATLKWNRDMHNFMIYATAAVPVGTYDPTRLATLGMGHWAADAGTGYTYLNEKAGIEFSAVFGLTYNLINPETRYRSGTDVHLDWAFSPYVSNELHIGAVGYFYNQLSGDSGAGAVLGEFKSRVAAIGPQIGFFLPLGDRQSYLNFRTYYEFAAHNRLEGWNAFVTFSIEPLEKKGSTVLTKR
jgi:hypothetical protein